MKIKSGGFSLLEMSLVVVIIGLLLAPFYNVILSLTQLQPNEQRIDRIRYGLAEHYRVFGTLPCPSDLTAAPGDANYYVGNCAAAMDTGAGVLVGALPLRDMAGATDCLSGSERDDYIAALPVDLQGVLQRDINRSGAIRENTLTPRQKFGLGKAGCVSNDLLLDDHGNKFVYAVTTDATNFAVYDPTDLDAGRIRILDRNGQSLTRRDQLFVLLSYGEDGKGAYSSEGVLNVALCGPDTAVLDNENCNLDDNDFRSAPFANIENSDHFDDFIDYSFDNALNEHSLWYWKDSGDANSRDLQFQPDRRLILDDDPTATDDDLLVVGDGNIAVTRTGGTGGNVAVEGNVDAPKYCYNVSTNPDCAP